MTRHQNAKRELYEGLAEREDELAEASGRLAELEHTANTAICDDPHCACHRLRAQARLELATETNKP